ncbi:MAG: TRAP transporter permease, partial [Deltaproteobacteria bacterium]|nr:TRAP transporter permease [Deltaproteobacteria bacterium]
MHHVNLKNLTFVFALILFVWLIWYFYTGSGGPLELVAHLLSIALILQILFLYQQDYLYKLLPPKFNHVIVVLYIAIALYA